MDKLRLLKKYFTFRDNDYGSFLYRGTDCVQYFVHRNNLYIESPANGKVVSIPLYFTDVVFMVEVNKAFEELSV